MALTVKDRVKESTTTTGTSDFTLGGAAAGFQTFAVIGNGNTTYYAAVDQATGDWEVGIGTYSSTGPTLTRDTILESSNSGSKVSFSSGSKDVFCTYPAERAVYLNAAGSAVDVIDVGTLGVGTANITTANITAGTVSTTPVSGNDLANKTYVDTMAASGITYHAPVKYEVPDSVGSLNATYNNGAAGVGATLTNAGTLAAFAPDGPTTSPGDRILVYNQTNAYENGVYTVTTVGNGSTAWVLTRATDADTYAVKSPNGLGQGDAFFITSGNTGAGETYVCNTTGTITFGTTAITFVQISDATLYTAGTGLTLSGTEFSITPVGTAATYGSASQVPVFTTNASGQVSSVTNTAIAISSAAVSGLAASATTDTTNAANITSGTLPADRLNGSYTGVTGVGTLTAGTWNGSTIGATYGGTGQTSYTQGDLLYASSATTVGKLADVAAGNALLSGGVGADPAWGKVGLTTHVSGTLAVSNGGTGATTLTGYVKGNGTSAFTAAASIPNSDTTATSANTASAIVARDGSGNFSAGTITASLSGNASTATSATSATTATNLAGGVAGAVPYQSGSGATAFSAAGTSGQYLQSNGTSAPSWVTPPTIGNGTLSMGVSGTGLSGSASFTANQSGNTTFTVTSNATSANTASTIVARDASGNFSAGTITAALSGNATTATTASTANSLNSANSYTVTGLTLSTADAYMKVNRTSSSSGQVGYNWSQGGSNLWWNYVDTSATTLSWYNSVTTTNVMTLTTGGALNVVGAITQNGNQVLHAGNYNSYALPLSGGTVTGTLTLSAANGPLRVGGSGYVVNPTTMVIGQYTSTIGYLQVPSSGQIDIWNNGTGTIATFYNNGTFNAGNVTSGGNQVLHAGNYTSYVGNGTFTVTAGTGLSGGGTLGTANQSGNSSVTLSLPNTGVTATSYTNANITVDAQGRITAASNGSGGTTLTTKLLRARYLTSGTSYTPASDVGAFYVQIYGATGGASGANLGGIGGPGYSEKYYSSPSGSYTYAIGAGGSPGAAGGTSTFGGVMTVTGSGGVTSATGSAGGVGSGGDFNATGGTGGNRTSSYGGCGGAGSRAGNGGNGGNDGGANGQGGTGLNHASGTTPGMWATAPSASAIVMPWGNTSESFSGYINGGLGGGAHGAPLLSGSYGSLYGFTANTGGPQTWPLVPFGGLGGFSTPYPFARYVNSTVGGQPAVIVIIEVLK